MFDLSLFQFFRWKFLVFLIALQVQISLPAQAQEQALFPPIGVAVKEDKSAPSLEKSEFVDRRTGSTYFEMPIFNLNVSSRLSMEVGISFNKAATFSGQIVGNYSVSKLNSGRTGVGGWNLEIPRIIGSRYEDYVCGRSSAFSFFLPGQGSIRFIKNSRPDLYPGADYVSANNWVVRCKKSVTDPLQVSIKYSYTLVWSGGYVSTGDFDIISPENVVYDFSRLPQQAITADPLGVFNGKSLVPNIDTYRSGSIDGISFSSPPFYPTRIYDGFGNEIRFNFENGRLTTISSSQGHLINLGYEAMSFKASPPKGSGSAVTESIPVLRTLQMNDRTWRLNYSVCADKFGLGCFDSDWVDHTNDTYGHLLKYVLRDIVRPDGQKISLKYRSMRKPVESDFFAPRPGVHYHISDILRPSLLTASYTYYSTCSYYFDGFGLSEVGRLLPLQGFGDLSSNYAYFSLICSPLFSLSSRTYKTAAGESRGVNYYYHVPGFTTLNSMYASFLAVVSANTSSTEIDQRLKMLKYDFLAKVGGDGLNRSITFEVPWGTKTLNTYVFKRDSHNSEINDPAANSTDAFSLIEKSTLLAPETVASGMSLPVGPPSLPSMDPLSGSVLQSLDGSIITNIKYSSELPVIRAVCLGNGSVAIFCEIRNNQLITAPLPEGITSLDFYLVDLLGNLSARKSIQVINKNVPAVMGVINSLLFDE